MTLNRLLLVFLLTLLVVSYFVNLSVVPLHLEEPRRALIALEMMYNENLIVPTEMGVPYFKKPPLFNWLIVGSFKLFGVSEFSARLVTVLSMLGMGLLTFFFVRKHGNRTWAILSGVLVLVSADLYYHFSLLAEIDVFYSLIVLASIYAIYHFDRAGKRLKLFMWVYVLTAIGFLTKGFPSLVFVAVSLGIWFLAKRNLKALLSWQHISGIVVLFILCGAYFLVYAQYNDPSGFAKDMWSQSSERTLIENSSADFFLHLITFPFTILKDILPASLFIVFLFHKDIRKQWMQNDVVRFCLLLFAANIIVYWISPGTRTRYIYMLYPLLIIPLSYLGMLGLKTKLNTALQWLMGVLIFLLAGASVYLNWAPQLSDFDILIPTVVIGAALLAILITFVKWKSQRIWLFVLALVATRFLFDLVILPARALEGEIPKDYNSAQRILALTEGENLHIYRANTDGFFPLETVFYIEKGREETLQSTLEKNCDDYFISFERRVRNEEVEIYHEMEWRDTRYYLLKFKECQ
jgi:4-amino-4-deoxy-L-arabinose transferase-like glycosyltransferase